MGILLFQLFTTEYDVSCRLVIYDLYYVAVHSLYTQFVDSIYFECDVEFFLNAFSVSVEMII